MAKRRVAPQKGKRGALTKKRGPSEVTIVFFSLVVVFFLYSIITRSPRKPPATSHAVTRVQVLNGCGVDGLAAKAAKFLRLKGYDVVDVKNTPLLLESLVVDRVGNRDAARKLAKLLGVSEENIIQQSCDYLELDLTVILGKDYKELKLNRVGEEEQFGPKS